MKKIIILIALLAFIVLLNYWYDKRDEELRIWTGRYEKCVWEKLGMTPTEAYQIHGTYPDCNVKK